MPKKKTATQPEITKSLLNFKSKLCTNTELSDRFVSDVIRITGLEIDAEGYLVDSEDDAIEPDYIAIKGKPVRYATQGILHGKDILFDPYNNLMIMEELFQQTLAKFHPEVSNSQIYACKRDKPVPKVDAYGFVTIMYGNGAKISTACHFKDTTKYLDAFMRLESMTDSIILETLKPYDDYEKAFFANTGNLKGGK